MLESLVRELIILGVWLVVAGATLGAGLVLIGWGVWVWVS